jgi:predicted small integral membrane protein
MDVVLMWLFASPMVESGWLFTALATTKADRLFAAIVTDSEAERLSVAPGTNPERTPLGGVTGLDFLPTWPTL